jgi:hypothetical protein
MGMFDDYDISILIGKTLQEVKSSDSEIGFSVSPTENYRLFHEQD